MNAIGNWTVEQVGGHPCEIFRPENPHPHQYTLVYLHGVHLGSLRDKPAFVSLFEQHGLTVLAPQTRRSWWADRVCPEFDANLTAERHVLDNVLPFAQQMLLGGQSDRKLPVGLLGTSMGGQGALRFSYKYPDTFPVVAAISPAVDYQLRMEDPEEEDPLFDMYDDPEQCRQDTALLHIHPLNWPRHQFFCCDPADYRWYDSSDRLRMKLGSLGVPFECDLDTTAGGHGFQYYSVMAQRAIEFILYGLDRERLRIV